MINFTEEEEEEEQEIESMTTFKGNSDPATILGRIETRKGELIYPHLILEIVILQIDQKIVIGDSNNSMGIMIGETT